MNFLEGFDGNLLLKMAIEMVDLPSKNGDFPSKNCDLPNSR